MKNIAEKEPIVFVSGSFDNLRTNDIRFLQEASKLGSVHAMLFSDTLSKKTNGKGIKFPQEERMYFLRNIRFVDDVRVIESPGIEAISIIKKKLDINNTYWAIRESEANARKMDLCAKEDINLSIIPDAALNGFPLFESRPDCLSKKVMVSGCFDWVHSGHVRFFEEAAQYGDLYVVVGHDENLRLLKGSDHPLFPQQERQYWVHAIRFVHRALISSGNGWLDAEPEVLHYKPDIFIVNEDGDKPEKKELFEKLGVEYLVLERKPKEGLQARQSTHLRGF